MAASLRKRLVLSFFKWLGKEKKLEDRDAWAYGLGHGGLEMLYLGMGSLISLLIPLFHSYNLQTLMRRIFLQRVH